MPLQCTAAGGAADENSGGKSFPQSLPSLSPTHLPARAGRSWPGPAPPPPAWTRCPSSSGSCTGGDRRQGEGRLDMRRCREQGAARDGVSAQAPRPQHALKLPRSPVQHAHSQASASFFRCKESLPARPPEEGVEEVHPADRLKVHLEPAGGLHVGQACGGGGGTGTGAWMGSVGGLREGKKHGCNARQACGGGGTAALRSIRHGRQERKQGGHGRGAGELPAGPEQRPAAKTGGAPRQGRYRPGAAGGNPGPVQLQTRSEPGASPSRHSATKGSSVKMVMPMAASPTTCRPLRQAEGRQGGREGSELAARWAAQQAARLWFNNRYGR